MAKPRCLNCGGTKWTTEGPHSERGRCVECREFPTLGWEIIDFIEDRCAIPDRFVAGDPFLLTNWQKLHLLHQYRVWPWATFDPNAPSAPFTYYGNYLVAPQKKGKGPFSAARICNEAEGPALFSGWDAEGQPVGMPWPTPHIQVTAVSEAQTRNIYRALLPMIEMGSIAVEIDDLGLTRINLASGGLIEPVTASARSRLGQRITYSEQDEPQSWTEKNGGHDLADNQRRNLAGTGGRWSATGNAYDPGEHSVMQLDHEAAQPGVYFNYPEPLPGSWGNKRERRRILKHAYEGSPWIDIPRIEADCDRLAAKGDPGQAERYFGNRIVAGASKAFDIQHYKTLEAGQVVYDVLFETAVKDHRKKLKAWRAKRAKKGNPAGEPPPAAPPIIGIPEGRLVALGFDGALTFDGTGIVATDVATGHQVVVQYWERPKHLPDDEDWSVPVDELDEAIDWAFTYWNVWRLNGDPPHYREEMGRWAGNHPGKVVEWWTNQRKKTAYALKTFRTDMRAGVMSHGPLNDSPEARANHAELLKHIGNAIRRSTNIRDEEDDKFLWLIGKPSQKSVNRIDLAMAALLSWMARQEAIAAGALNEETYSRGAW